MTWFKAFLTDRKACVRINDTRDHVTIVRLTDVRPRRRENVRPLSLRTFACFTFRSRSYAGRIPTITLSAETV